MPEPFDFPRVQAIPEIQRASLRLDGREVLAYEFAPGESRPFFYPLRGPSGAELTRMGHPNPVGHEHHKSIWFAHQKVIPGGGDESQAVNFWEEPRDPGVRIRHERVWAYRDGDDFSALAADLAWMDHDKVLIRQHLIAALVPMHSGYAIDLQSRFEAPSGPITLGKTNFGFLGVRVAKTISEQFGGGRLTNDKGETGEGAIFGKTSRWVDYSGPSKPDVVEGIAILAHPSNPNSPTHWHVRRDGWFSPAFNLETPWGIAADHPLDLRYLLWVHSGAADIDAINLEWDGFAEGGPYVLQTGKGVFPTIEFTRGG